jgi:threonine dehydrogenase-like Zn-dependent dehydrogenase
VPKNKTLRKVYDAVTTKQTVTSIIQLLSASGGEVNVVLRPPEDLNVPENVKILRTVVGTAYAEDEDFARKSYRILGRWLEEGKFEGNKARVMPNGLASVPEGLALLRDGKVSAEKLVCK